MRYIFLSLLILLSGCTLVPVKKSTLQKQEKEVAQLRVEKSDLEKQKSDIQIKYSILKTEKEHNIGILKDNRVSVGGAQAIAVLGTLNAEPNKTKYTTASIKGLGVTKNAIQDFVVTKDLLDAIETQNNLISEQAVQIAEGNKKIEELNKDIDNKKRDAIKLLSDIQALEEQKIKEVGAKLIEISKKDDVIKKKESDLKEKSELLNSINEEKAAKFDKENSFWNKINPLNGLTKFFSSIFIWIIVFVVFGLILKICSIIFPGVNVLQIIVKGIGSLVGGILKLIFGAIPGLFSGLGAVDKKDFDKEKKIADSSIGAIQEMKYENPEIYNNALKAKLLDWFKDSPELEQEIEKKLKELNLK